MRGAWRLDPDDPVGWLRRQCYPDFVAKTSCSRYPAMGRNDLSTHRGDLGKALTVAAGFTVVGIGFFGAKHEVRVESLASVFDMHLF